MAYLVAFSRATALKLRIKPLNTTIMLLSRYEVTVNSRPHLSNTYPRYPTKLARKSASFADPIPSLNTPLPLGTTFPSPVTFHRAEILILGIVMTAFISSRRLVEQSSWTQYLTMLHRHTWPMGRINTKFVGMNSRWDSKHIPLLYRISTFSL